VLLDEREKERYQRQIRIPQMGWDGQLKLKNARVLIAGIGGLGSISAYYLAAAGIGHLRLVDRDVVCLQDLNRQMLHTAADVGRPKTESALEKLRQVNPYCRIEAFQMDICGGQLKDLLEGCRLIVDATDNTAARYTLNIASQQQQIPFIYGGISGFDGMVTTFIPGHSACFACLFPDTGASGRPAPIPVAGPAAGIIASIQSMEAIKLIVGMQELLCGRLLQVDGAKMKFKAIPIEADPLCRVCGQKNDGSRRAS